MGKQVPSSTPHGGFDQDDDFRERVKPGQSLDIFLMIGLIGFFHVAQML